jgi:predicted DNA-binding protein
MPAPRKIDPTGQEASTHFVGIRLPASHKKQLDELCVRVGQSRSNLLRRLIQEELERVTTQA